MHTRPIPLLLACGAIVTAGPVRRALGQDFGRPAAILAEDSAWLAAVRAAGLAHDRTAIARLRATQRPPDSVPMGASGAALKAPRTKYDEHTLVRALAQLGPDDALPFVKEVLARPEESEVTGLAAAVRARLEAEAQTSGITDPARRAAEQVRLFLEGIKLTPAALNAQVRADWQECRSRTHPGVGRGRYALRELADMAYRGGGQPLVDCARGLGIDFAAEPAAALKVRLAPLSRRERVATLVSELAQKQVLTGDDYYAVQLAVDEGSLAVQAVAASIAGLARQEQPYAGLALTAMFDILRGVGSKGAEPLLRPFLIDADPRVANVARQAYRHVAGGVGMQYRAGY